jgi:hypothetical protein
VILIRTYNSHFGFNATYTSKAVLNKIYVVLIKSEGKTPLGRHRRRWNYIIRTDLTEIGYEVVDWKHLAQDRDQVRVNLPHVLN